MAFSPTFARIMQMLKSQQFLWHATNELLPSSLMYFFGMKSDDVVITNIINLTSIGTIGLMSIPSSVLLFSKQCYPITCSSSNSDFTLIVHFVVWLNLAKNPDPMFDILVFLKTNHMA